MLNFSSKGVLRKTVQIADLLEVRGYWVWPWDRTLGEKRPYRAEAVSLIDGTIFDLRWGTSLSECMDFLVEAHSWNWMVSTQVRDYSNGSVSFSKFPLAFCVSSFLRFRVEPGNYLAYIPRDSQEASRFWRGEESRMGYIVSITDDSFAESLLEKVSSSFKGTYYRLEVTPERVVSVLGVKEVM